jgi:deoxyadenosine/deoxycytidine kinase
MMSARDFNTYTDLCRNVLKTLPQPDLIVLLDVSPEIALERIRARGLECEKSITLDYMQQLALEYEQFAADVAGSAPIMRIDYSQFPVADKKAVVMKILGVLGVLGKLDRVPLVKTD